MPNLTVTFRGNPLPSNFNGTLQDFYQYILDHIVAEISSDYLLLGQIGGAEPATNVGPWVNGLTWYIHNGSDYVPATIRIGTGVYVITLAGTPTANRTITFQNRAGTVALLDDVYVPRGTQVLTGTTVGVNWSLSNSFYHKLTGNTVYAMANSIPGQEIWMAVVNDATAYTVTWPSNVIFTGATNPVQTTAGVGEVRADVYVLKNIGGTIYARATQNYY